MRGIKKGHLYVPVGAAKTGKSYPMTKPMCKPCFDKQRRPKSTLDKLREYLKSNDVKL